MKLINSQSDSDSDAVRDCMKMIRQEAIVRKDVGSLCFHQRNTGYSGSLWIYLNIFLSVEQLNYSLV